MVDIPVATKGHYTRMLGFQTAASRAAAAKWRRVDSRFISESWLEQLSTLAPFVVAQQFNAALSGAMSVAPTLGEQGSWSAPDAFPDVAALAGYAPDGRDLSGLLYSPATRAKTLIGDGRSVTDAMNSAGAWLAMIVATMVADAGRQAAGIMIAARPRTGYVRMVNPPSCSRCVQLAGRFYRWNTGFQRHPHCDCVHVASQAGSSGGAKAEGLIDDPYEAFRSLSRAEQDKTFGRASAQAIRDGSDISQVVNAKRGMTSTGLFTTEGTARGYAKGVLAPGQRRATPELIYRWADGDRAEALRLLEQHGYILPGGQVPGGALRGAVEGFGQMGRGGARKAASQAVLEARRTGARDGSVYTMTAAERRVADAERDWLEVLAGRNPWSSAALERRGGAAIRAVDTPLTPQIAAAVEQRYLQTLAANGERYAESGPSRPPESL